MPDWVRAAAAAAAMAASGAACFGQTTAPGEFERDLTLPALSHPEAACAVLDGPTAAYSAGSRSGMTLWADSRPVPFSLTINSPEESAGDAARIANFQSGAGTESFDLLMPARSYSSVTLDLAAPGAVWNARLSAAGSTREIGRYVLFDLSNRGGPVKTVMDFAERDDHVLHVTFDRAISRSELRGAWVAPSRSEQTLFTTIAAATPKIEGQRSVAEFSVAEGVPVERVAFQVSGAQEFRRRVTVSAQATGGAATVDRVDGFIQQMHAVREGAELNVSDLSLPAVLPDNARSPMRVTIAVDNGIRASLPIREVELQMRQREICFTAWPGAESWRLFYGAPTVDFTSLGGPPRSLVERANPVVARLGPEKLAADFHPLAAPVNSPRRAFWFVLAVAIFAATLLAVFLRIVRIPHVRR